MNPSDLGLVIAVLIAFPCVIMVLWMIYKSLFNQNTTLQSQGGDSHETLGGAEKPSSSKKKIEKSSLLDLEMGKASTPKLTPKTPKHNESSGHRKNYSTNGPEVNDFGSTDKKIGAEKNGVLNIVARSRSGTSKSKDAPTLSRTGSQSKLARTGSQSRVGDSHGNLAGGSMMTDPSAAEDTKNSSHIDKISGRLRQANPQASPRNSTSSRPENFSRPEGLAAPRLEAQQKISNSALNYQAPPVLPNTDNIIEMEDPKPLRNRDVIIPPQRKRAPSGASELLRNKTSTTDNSTPSAFAIALEYIHPSAAVEALEKLDVQEAANALRALDPEKRRAIVEAIDNPEFEKNLAAFLDIDNEVD